VRPALLYLGPEPLRGFGLRSLHALAVAELRRTPLRRSSQNSVERKSNFREPFLSNKRSVRKFSGHFRKGKACTPNVKKT
jgi:hypothetical protein